LGEASLVGAEPANAHVAAVAKKSLRSMTTSA
jgi:hypothetical protein